MEQATHACTASPATWQAHRPWYGMSPSKGGCAGSNVCVPQLGVERQQPPLAPTAPLGSARQGSPSQVQGRAGSLAGGTHTWRGTCQGPPVGGQSCGARAAGGAGGAALPAPPCHLGQHKAVLPPLVQGRPGTQAGASPARWEPARPLPVAALPGAARWAAVAAVAASTAQLLPGAVHACASPPSSRAWQAHRQGAPLQGGEPARPPPVGGQPGAARAAGWPAVAATAGHFPTLGCTRQCFPPWCRAWQAHRQGSPLHGREPARPPPVGGQPVAARAQQVQARQPHLPPLLPQGSACHGMSPSSKAWQAHRQGSPLHAGEPARPPPVGGQPGAARGQQVQARQAHLPPLSPPCAVHGSACPPCARQARHPGRGHAHMVRGLP